jgi:hypothetical protein
MFPNWVHYLWCNSKKVWKGHVFMNSWSANERASGYCFFIIALQIESSQIGWVFFHAPHKILTASFTLFYYCITNSELSWETLEQRRAKTRAVLVYKIINNLVDIPSHTLLIPPDGRTRGTTVYRVIYTRLGEWQTQVLLGTGRW